MADKYSTIQQHQPLRVPAGWDKQEKALIVQLDEIFDDIYRRFGRLRIEDMGKAFQKRIENDEGDIAELLLDIGEIIIDVGNKYDKVSGITINANGIGISGSKYVDIGAGCSLDIASGGNANIKSGGKMTVESGAGIDVASGGDINVKSGGGLNVNSGATIDINATGNLKLAGATVEIKSGSSFDVDATNFKISSNDKKMVTGNWTFDDKGMVYDDPNYQGGFEIAEYSQRDAETSGLFYRRYVTGDGTVDRQLILKVESYDGDDKYESNFLIGTEILAGGTKNKYFVPGRSDGFGNFIGTEAYPFDKGYIKWLRNVDIITVDQNGTYKQIGEPSHPFDSGNIKQLRNVDIITIDQNGTYKQLGEPSHPFYNGYIISGYINNVRKVNYIEADSSGNSKRIGDSSNKFNSIYVDSIRYVDSITLDPNATYKQIGEPTYPFDTEYVNKLRKVDYIEVKSDGSYKQIGFPDAPFERIYAKKLYGAIACQYTTITDYNSLTTDGRFWVNAADMTHGPSTLTAGVAEIEVVTISTSYVRQRIYSQYKIYSRERYNGTWGSWYQFTGEAV